MLLRYLYKGGTTIKESKGIPITKVRSGYFQREGKRSGPERGIHRHWKSFVFQPMWYLHDCVLYHYLLSYIHDLCNFLYVCCISPKNVTKSESHVLLSSVNFSEELGSKGKEIGQQLQEDSGLKESGRICSPKYIYKYIHSRTIHNSPKLENTQMFIQQQEG